jgi:hypothetical protein
VPTPPLTQLEQAPRPPSPEPVTFEAPQAEWDALRCVNTLRCGKLDQNANAI